MHRMREAVLRIGGEGEAAVLVKTSYGGRIEVDEISCLRRFHGLLEVADGHGDTRRLEIGRQGVDRLLLDEIRLLVATERPFALTRYRPLYSLAGGAVSPHAKKSGLKAARKFAYPLLIVPNGREKAQYRKSAADRLLGESGDLADINTASIPGCVPLGTVR